MIFTAHVARSVLTIRQQEVHIVRPDVILSEVDDSHGQRGFTVVVRCDFRNITDELSDFDLFLELAFEATPDNLSLTWFETIRYRWYRSDVVGHREQDELFVDEIRERDLVNVVIKVCPGLGAGWVRQCQHLGIFGLP